MLSRIRWLYIQFIKFGSFRYVNHLIAKYAYRDDYTLTYDIGDGDISLAFRVCSAVLD